MKDIFKTGIVLTIVCVISAMVLSFVYQQTQPVIIKEREKKITIAQKEVLPEAVVFKPIQLGEKEFSVGYDDYGNPKGVVIKICSKGYSGLIETMIGINNEKKVEGIKILRHTETPGLGAKITQEEFLKQFKEKKSEGLGLKKEDSKGEIDAITGATISSKAIVSGVRDTLEWLNKNYYAVEKK